MSRLKVPHKSITIQHQQSLIIEQRSRHEVNKRYLTPISVYIDNFQFKSLISQKAVLHSYGEHLHFSLKFS